MWGVFSAVFWSSPRVASGSSWSLFEECVSRAGESSWALLHSLHMVNSELMMGEKNRCGQPFTQMHICQQS